MKNTKKVTATGVGFMFLLLACQNDKFTNELPVVKNNVSFSADIQPIISAQCAGCHNPGNVMPDFRKEFAYASLT